MKEMTEEEQRSHKIKEGIEKFKLAVLNEFFEGIPSKSQLKKITQVNDFEEGNTMWPTKVLLYYRHEVLLGHIEITNTHMRWVTDLKYSPIPKKGLVERTAKILDGSQLDNFPKA